jgi:hypothetical protein
MHEREAGKTKVLPGIPGGARPSPTAFISGHDGVEDDLVDSRCQDGAHRRSNGSQLTDRRKPGRSRERDKDKVKKTYFYI